MITDHLRNEIGFKNLAYMIVFLELEVDKEIENIEY